MTIVVPEGMREMVMKQLAVVRRGRGLEEIADILMMTAVGYLATHIMVPCDEQIHEFYSGESEAGVSFEFLQRFALWWGRRMFMDEDPVPDGVAAAIRGRTFTRGQADRIIDLVNMCVPPEGK